MPENAASPPLAPIVLFAYARPAHTRRTVESLLENPLAARSDLVVYSDGPRTPDARDAVEAVREYLATLRGFHSVTLRPRKENRGLARSVITGVTEVLDAHDRAVVLEDDLVLSPHFLAYMNEALDRFADDERVASVHGYVYPVGRPLPEAFFLRGADCWGWATWRRAWRLFDPDGRHLLDELQRRDLVRSFDFDGARPYSRMLEDQVQGRKDSWAIRWHASAFLAGKLTLYPGRTLVQNIGTDGTGTHGEDTSALSSALSETPIDLSHLAVEPSPEGWQAFKAFFLAERPVGAGDRVRRALTGVAREVLPPALARAGARIAGAGAEAPVTYEGDYPDWDAARSRCSGYDASAILEKVLDATLRVSRGEAAFERDSVVFGESDVTSPIPWGIFWGAARSGGRLDVLDLGGSLGSTYFKYRRLLDGLPGTRWNVVDQPHYVEAGRRHLQDERLRFHASIGDCLREARPNVILLSSVLQYLPRPHEVLEELRSAGSATVVVDRTTFTELAEDRIAVQRVPPSIYEASYPLWLLSRTRFLREAAPTWRLVDSGLSPEGNLRTAEGLSFAYRWMLLTSRG